MSLFFTVFFFNLEFNVIADRNTNLVIPCKKIGHVSSFEHASNALCPFTDRPLKRSSRNKSRDYKDFASWEKSSLRSLAMIKKRKRISKHSCKTLTTAGTTWPRESLMKRKRFERAICGYFYLLSFFATGPDFFSYYPANFAVIPSFGYSSASLYITAK